jgi:hypothetical protein
MKTEIKIPYSEDCFTVETEVVPPPYDLLIVRVSTGQFRVTLTPTAAIELGLALIDASNDTTWTP